jgi:anti-sigma factor RsiW
MISCQNVIDFCLEYLEGVLPEEERSRFQRHLSVCGECVAFFETYRRTPEISKQALAAEMPSQLKDAVRSYLRSRCQSDGSSKI